MQLAPTTKDSCGSAANYQACVEQCFVQLREHLLAWIHDFLLYHSTESDLFKMLDRFLQICADHRLLVSLPKSNFLETQIKWHGRTIDATGVTMDRDNFERIKSAVEPHTAGELCEYVYCIAWMSAAIPRFAERSAWLYKLHEEAYRRPGRREKKAIAKFTVTDLG